MVFLAMISVFIIKKEKKLKRKSGSGYESESAPKRSADGYVADAAFERGKERQDC